MIERLVGHDLIRAAPRETVERALARRQPTLIEPGDGDRSAAVSLVVRPTKEEIELLFVRRTEVAGDPWSGQMALPGGHAEPGDEDLVDTARRETFEEVGVDLPRDAFLGRLDDIHPMTRRLPSVVVSPFVAWLEEEARLRASAEVQYHHWVPLSALLDPGRQSELRLEPERGRERVFPTIVFAGDTIWGLTHRVVMNFLEVLAGAIE